MRNGWIACAGLLAACVDPSNEQQGLAQGTATMQQLCWQLRQRRGPWCFHGTASASDSIPAEPSSQLSFSNQPVIAALNLRGVYAFDFVNASGNAAVLRITASATGDYVVLEQTGGATTHFGTVSTSNQSGSQWESCDNCVPDLMNKPATISIASVTATGTAGPGGDILQTTVSAQLGVVAPSTLTFASILVTARLRRPLRGRPAVDRRVDDRRQRVGRDGDAAGTPDGRRARTTPRSAVHGDDLREHDRLRGEFGARDHVGGSPQSKCAP